MKLYYGPGTCSVAVWIALDWLGADYEVEKADFGSEEYLKINPAGVVPALDLGNGKILTQLGAILSYLVEKYPEGNLGPDDSPEDRYDFNKISYFLSADYHPVFKPIFGPGGYTTSTDKEDLEKVKEAAYKKIDGAASLLDSMVAGKDHIYKDKKTVLDAYAFVLSKWLELTPKSWTEYPNLKNFMEKVGEDEAVKRIMEQSSK